MKSCFFLIKLSTNTNASSTPSPCLFRFTQPHHWGHSMSSISTTFWAPHGQSPAEHTLPSWQVNVGNPPGVRAPSSGFVYHVAFSSRLGCFNQKPCQSSAIWHPQPLLHAQGLLPCCSMKLDWFDMIYSRQSHISCYSFPCSIYLKIRWLIAPVLFWGLMLSWQLRSISGLLLLLLFIPSFPFCLF